MTVRPATDKPHASTRDPVVERFRSIATVALGQPFGAGDPATVPTAPGRGHRRGATNRRFALIGASGPP
jgi:hypothetical protein